MSIPVKISLEQLAETLNSLSVTEREALKRLLDNQWKETAEVNNIVEELLKKSTEEHRQGKIRSAEDVIRESKEKYGL